MKLKYLVENERNESASKDDSMESNQIKSDAKRFRCHFCNKEYSINFHLKQHIRKNHEGCGKTFSQECDLNAHKDSIQGQKYDQSEVNAMSDIINVCEEDF